MSRSVKSLLQPYSSIVNVTMIPNGLLQLTLPIIMSPSFKHCNKVQNLESATLKHVWYYKTLSTDSFKLMEG